jgi:predicted transcriptional regulator YheO
MLVGYMRASTPALSLEISRQTIYRHVNRTRNA